MVDTQEFADSDTLPFKVASHMVEDLGLTLYTSLARVLVEFVANAYDADASHATITFDASAIHAAREQMRKDFQTEPAASPAGENVPLSERTLPSNLDITIEDDGHGMSREDLEHKFLIAGRRRRVVEAASQGRSPGGRPLMGRKGLGKLAGFGVGKLIEVLSRKAGEDHATLVSLDFDEILKAEVLDEIKVPAKAVDGGGGLPDEGGTRIRLANLLHDPTKNREATIQKELSDHFALISPAEFAIRMNGSEVSPHSPPLAFGWPEPDKRAQDLIDKTLDTEEGVAISFRYRLRFTKDGHALPASRRGIRVYANKRLCAAPSLLDANTNMHGFRMTDYLDGVVHADFIAEQKADYIATDRQGLRWDAPLLSGMKDFLSGEIKTACAAYQKKRDDESEDKVRDDEFTTQQIEKADLSSRDRRVAIRLAGLLRSACKQGTEDTEYKTKLPVMIQGLGHGDILTAMTSLAQEPHPDLQRLMYEAARLTKDELGRFLSTVRGRLSAISALHKIVEDVNFKSAENEKDIQQLCEDSPWLIDPTYTQFLTADKPKRALFQRLAKHLQIGDHAPEPSPDDSERPDLVFLLGNESLQRLVIVELKSANKPLELEHLTQLTRYMADAEEWLKDQNRSLRIHGQLIGSMPRPESKAKGARDLRNRLNEPGVRDWIVRDYLDVLEQTQAAHVELLEIQESVEDQL